MSFAVVIPARYAATRLPGKPLLDIDGKPMVQRVYEQATQSSASEVVVATDDARIAEVVSGFGGQVVMTRADHASGTDRLQEVAALRAWSPDFVVVNVQGDEPLLPPALIDQVAGNLMQHATAGIATLAEPIEQGDEVFNPNAVKVVMDAQGLALYFSRAPIPWQRGGFNAEGVGGDWQTGQHFRHVGIYAYRSGFLNRFVAWPPAALEQLEGLEQLRALHHGVPIHVAVACATVPAGVDTEADLEAVRNLFRDEAGA